MADRPRELGNFVADYPTEIEFYFFLNCFWATLWGT